MTVYCTNKEYGMVDDKKVLDLTDDVAHVKWGGSWRMPTRAEQNELRDKCKWTWTTKNGVHGCKFVGPNNNSIFLPAAGVRFDEDISYEGFGGYYWSSTLRENYPYYAADINFVEKRVGRDYHYRDFGLTVRPVCP